LSHCFTKYVSQFTPKQIGDDESNFRFRVTFQQVERLLSKLLFLSRKPPFGRDARVKHYFFHRARSSRSICSVEGKDRSFVLAGIQGAARGGGNAYAVSVPQPWARYLRGAIGLQRQEIFGAGARGREEPYKVRPARFQHIV
jgi:hypothetical protein